MSLAGFFTTNTEVLQVITGRLYKPNGTKRPVVWCHGSGDDQTECWVGQSGAYLPTLKAIADQLGLPIVAPLCAGTKTWGNDAAQTKVGDALSYVRSSFGASAGKAILVGLSMGGPLALNWARNNPTLVQAVLLFYPAVNVRACHDATGGATSFATDIEAAYGGLAAWNSAEPTHDPAATGIPASFTGVPIYVGYSDSDTTVGTANQAAWISAVGGSALTSRVYAGTAHPDMTKVSSSDVQTWLAQYV